ncbi:MAG: lyase family protein [Candidatus Aenigmatarchaeota archaeon]
MDVFDNISPLDHRYADEKLQQFLSENARIRYQLKVESAIASALAKRGICTKEIAKEISDACDSVSPGDVYEEEKRIRHDIRALVNCIRKKVSEGARPFVHLGATSFDIINTAEALRFKEFSEKVMIPSLLELEKTIIDIAMREKNTLQIGRTHGQHAEPITFGFALSEYVSRLGNSILEIKNSAEGLRGKMSGAVGAYNATSLIFEDPEEYELEVLNELRLKPATHSTQIVEPEFMLDFVHAVISSFGVIANLADDMRHLQRTEISEVAQSFSDNQVGSSTMPHKRNPIDFENVKSMWKAFVPRIMTLYMDQLSEHQRDLTNSASSRFVVEMLAGFLISVERMNKTCKSIVIDKGSMAKNFAINREMITAEPFYILLSVHGHPDAHEAVRRLTMKNRPLIESIKEDGDIMKYFNMFTANQKRAIETPGEYTGIASKKTESVCEYWEKMLRL